MKLDLGSGFPWHAYYIKYKDSLSVNHAEKLKKRRFRENGAFNVSNSECHFMGHI